MEFMSTILELPRPQRLRLVWACAWVAGLTLLFVGDLSRLARHALQSDLHSYIILVPFVAVYLLHINRPRVTSYRTSMGGACLTGGLALLALGGRMLLSGRLSVNDDLALASVAYVSSIITGGFLFFGVRWMAEAAFPAAFLFFLVPLPDRVVALLETASVLASADVAAWMFEATGTPLLRDGVVLRLPGIVLQVAQECSGIRSSWVLFITSLVVGKLFLRSPWRRLALAVFVLPLAIIRNGL